MVDPFAVFDNLPIGFELESFLAPLEVMQNFPVFRVSVKARRLVESLVEVCRDSPDRQKAHLPAYVSGEVLVLKRFCHNDCVFFVVLFVSCTLK